MNRGALRSAFVALGLAGCVRGAAPRASAPCEVVPTPVVADARVCAFAAPIEMLSGHPYHPDHDRVRLEVHPSAGDGPVLEVESTRVYSIERVVITLNLTDGRLHRFEHRTGDVPDRDEELGLTGSDRVRREEVLREMLGVVARIAAGGPAGPHDNRPHPELEPVLGLLRSLLDTT